MAHEVPGSATGPPLTCGFRKLSIRFPVGPEVPGPRLRAHRCGKPASTRHPFANAFLQA